VSDGGVGEMFSDLCRASPRRFAFVVAFALAAVITLAGVGADDRYDGLLREVLISAVIAARGR
jgi:hypothetical protein